MGCNLLNHLFGAVSVMTLCPASGDSPKAELQPVWEAAPEILWGKRLYSSPTGTTLGMWLMPRQSYTHTWSNKRAFVYRTYYYIYLSTCKKIHILNSITMWHH